MAKEQIETEQVTIQLPKKLMDFLRAHFKDPAKEYIQYSVIDSIRADINTDNVFLDSIIKKYDLDPSLKEFVEPTATID
jgi:hypothetical protein